MELWHQLSCAVDLPRVECQLAKNQEIWEAKYNKFVNEFSVFVNKELSEFRCSIMSLGESTTQSHGSAQATSRRIDRIQKEVTSIRSDLKEKIDRAMQEAKAELRTEFAAMINQKVVLLEEAQN